MIRHFAPRPDLPGKALTHRTENFEKTEVIAIIFEDRHPSIATRHHVVEGVFVFDAKGTSHAQRISRSLCTKQDLTPAESPGKALTHRTENFEKTEVIAIIFEDRHPSIATRHHVVEGVFVFDAKGTSHAQRISRSLCTKQDLTPAESPHRTATVQRRARRCRAAGAVILAQSFLIRVFSFVVFRNGIPFRSIASLYWAMSTSASSSLPTSISIIASIIIAASISSITLL